MQRAIEDCVAICVRKIRIGAVIEKKLDVVLLIAHDGPEERGGAAGRPSIDVGAMGDQELHHFIVIAGELGQVERRIPISSILLVVDSLGIHFICRVRPPGSEAKSRDPGWLLVAELLAEIVRQEGRVVVLCIHVGASVDQRLRNGELAVKRSHM